MRINQGIAKSNKKRATIKAALKNSLRIYQSYAMHTSK